MSNPVGEYPPMPTVAEAFAALDSLCEERDRLADECRRLKIKLKACHDEIDELTAADDYYGGYPG